MSWDEAALNREEIKPEALSIIEVRLCEGISWASLSKSKER